MYDTRAADTSVVKKDTALSQYAPSGRAGHSLFLHRSAPETHRALVDWLT